MLSKKEINKFLGLEGLGVVSAHIDSEDDVRISMKQDLDEIRCPKCFENSNKLIDYKNREVRDVDLFGRRCYIRFDHSRMECKRCYKTFYPQLLCMRKNSRYTKRFEEYVYEMCRSTTALRTAEYIDVSDKTARDICNRITERKVLLENAISHSRGINQRKNGRIEEAKILAEIVLKF